MSKYMLEGSSEHGIGTVFSSRRKSYDFDTFPSELRIVNEPLKNVSGSLTTTSYTRTNQILMEFPFESLLLQASPTNGIY